MDTIVLSCMDPRLNEYLDSKYLSNKQYGDVEIWRDASGRMPFDDELIRYIEKSGAKKVILAPHTDCKAYKHIYETLENKQNGNGKKDEIVEQAVKLIDGHPFKSRLEFDSLISKEEEAYLKSRLGRSGIKVELEVIDVSKLNSPNTSGQERVLIISNKTHRKAKELAIEAGSNLTSCYIIQGPDLKDFNPDINLAIDEIGIRKVSVLTDPKLPEKPA